MFCSHIALSLINLLWQCIIILLQSLQEVAVQCSTQNVMQVSAVMHSISNRTFWCFYCTIAMVHWNSNGGRLDGKPEVG